MKPLVLTLLASCALTSPAWADGTGTGSGFNPRFSASSAYADQPDYRPPDRPRSQYEFLFNVDVDPRWRDDPDPDRPSHHDRRRRR